MLKNAGVSRIISFDLHFHRLPGEFDFNGMKWTCLTAVKALITQAKAKFGTDFKVIGPDEGSSDILEYAGGEVVFSKRKICRECGKPAQECMCTTISKNYEIISELTKEIKAKNVLILDDIISSGGTVLKAIDKLKGKKVGVAVTHAFFSSEALSKIKSKTEFLITTNSVLNKAEVIDVVPLISDYLK